jgi:tetratricopeptide (TPR) repeat protein
MTTTGTSLSNENWIDRSVRALIGLALLQLAYFWLGGVCATIFYALSAVLLLTATVSFCPIYRALGMRSNGKPNTLGKGWLIVAGVAFITLLLAGSYASHFFTKKFYIEDFNAMNNHYKQALFFTGKENREKAVENYEQLLASYAGFTTKYLAYHPYALKADRQFDADLLRIEAMINDAAENVRSGDLQQAHLMLEEVRPVFQDIFKRNNFSMLSITLVDFHDAMELIIDAATAKDSAKVEALYPQVNEKMEAIEAEANDAEIQAIRNNLDLLRNQARSGTVDEMPAQGEKLKSSFVKVYLHRG